MAVAMGRFPGDLAVQRQGCWALLTLAASDDGADAVLAAGGAGAVVAAMVNCPSDAAVQHFGCWAVANLAFCPRPEASGGPEHENGGERAAALRSEGAAEVCAAALKKFPRHAGIAEKGALALEAVKRRRPL